MLDTTIGKIIELETQRGTSLSAEELVNRIVAGTCPTAASTIAPSGTIAPAWTYNPEKMGRFFTEVRRFTLPLLMTRLIVACELQFECREIHNLLDLVIAKFDALGEEGEEAYNSKKKQESVLYRFGESFGRQINQKAGFVRTSTAELVRFAEFSRERLHLLISHQKLIIFDKNTFFVEAKDAATLEGVIDAIDLPYGIGEHKNALFFDHQRYLVDIGVAAGMYPDVVHLPQLI